MGGGELHVQASLWSRCTEVPSRGRHRSGGVFVRCGESRDHGGRAHATSLAVLLLEGEAPDPAQYGAVRFDALYQAVLARGLRLITDLDRLDMRPIGGWQLINDMDGKITLRWPRPRELFSAVPLDAPSGWLAAAAEHRVVLVLIGYDLGLHASPANAVPHDNERVWRAATAGHLAAGAVRFTESAVAGSVADPDYAPENPVQ